MNRTSSFLNKSRRVAEMNLLVISHTPHYLLNGEISGWGSTVREIDQLATLFGEVVHLAPLHSESAPHSSLPYSQENIQFVAVKPAGGNRIIDKASILWRTPSWLAAMKREMLKADVIHIRCPAGISLVALLAQRLWGKGKPCWVKYAGNWKPLKREPLSYRFQRFWIGKNCHHGVATVNGDWVDQLDHILSFNNPSFSRSELYQARLTSVDKKISAPLELLFVGRVEIEKGVGRVIQIAAGLLQRGSDFHINIIGDGPNRKAYEQVASEHGLAGRIDFLGWKKRLEINDYYREAHLVLLPSSSSEGWPKVLSEAMAYGVVPLASTTSSIPLILSQAQTGQAIPADDIDSYVDAIISYTENHARWKIESTNGLAMADSFTYEHYLSDVKKLFNKTWNINLEKPTNAACKI